MENTTLLLVIDKKLKKQFKMLTIDNDTNMSKVLSEMIKKYISENK